MLIAENCRKEQLTIELDILPHHRSSSLILLVQRNGNGVALNSPSADFGNELVVLDVQPRLKQALVYALHALTDDNSHPYPHQLLEALDVGRQVGVQVVAVER